MIVVSKVLFAFLLVMLVQSDATSNNRFIFRDTGINDFKCKALKDDNKISIFIEGVVDEYGDNVNVDYPFAPSLVVSFDEPVVSENEVAYGSFSLSLGYLFDATQENFDEGDGSDHKISFKSVIGNPGRLMLFSEMESKIMELSEKDFFGKTEGGDLNLTVSKTDTTKFIFDQKLKSLYLLFLLTPEPKKCFTKINVKD